MALELIILVSMGLVLARAGLAAARSNLRSVVWSQPSSVDGRVRRPADLVTIDATPVTPIGVVIDAAFGDERVRRNADDAAFGEAA